MPSTRRPLRTPDESRAKAPAGTVRPISAGQSLAQRTGTNLYGQNTAPVEAYRQPPASTIIQFAPGDPVMPVPGIDDGTGAPRQYGYLVGQNILPQPRNTELISFEQLRNVSAGYEGIQLCEAAIFRVLSRLELQVTPRPEYLNDDDPSAEKWRTPGLQMAEWFQEPDQRGTDLRAWITAAMRDLLELDAVGVYHRQTNAGGLYGLELVNGATLACLVDAGGRTPLADAPAYAQYLYGVPTGVYSADEIDYLKQTTRTDSMYGLGPVERIILRVITAIRAEAQQLRRFTDGASPYGTIEASSGNLSGMTFEQLQAWERQWNALLAGNDALRVRAKVMPPGWTFKSLEPPEVNTAFDDFLLNITISSFGLTKDELGFTDTSNRSVGESQQDVVYRNAVKPNADFFARYFANVIRRYDGQPIAKKNATVSLPGSATRAKQGTWDKRFYITWGGYEEPEDFQAKAGALANLVSRAIISPEEAQRQLKIRPEQGQKPIGRFIIAPGGAASVVFMDDTVDQRDAANKARLAQLQTQEKQGDMQLQQMQLQIQAGKEQIKRQQQGDDDAESLGDDEGQDDGAQDTGDDGGGDDTGGGGGSGTGGQAGGSDDESGPQPVDLDAEDEDNNASRSIGAAEWRGLSTSVDAARSADALGRESDGDVLRRGADPAGDTGGASRFTGGFGPAGSAELVGDTAIGRGEYYSQRYQQLSRTGRAGEQPGTGDTGVGSATQAQGAVHQEAVSQEAVSAEWRRYRDKALSAVKHGRPVPEFASTILPADLHAYVAARLRGVQDTVAVRAIFAEARIAEEQRWSPTAWMDQPRENGKFASTGPKDVPMPADLKTASEHLTDIITAGSMLPNDHLGTERDAAVHALGDHLRGTAAFVNLAQSMHGSWGDHTTVTDPVHAAVDALQHMWGQTSEDNPHLVALQRAVSAELGVPMRTQDFRPDVFATGDALFRQHEAGWRAYVRAQYEQTQEWLHAHGLAAGSTVTVFRGVQMPVFPADMHAGVHTQSYAMRPLSSWTSDLDTARYFAKYGGVGAIHCMDIPIEHLFGVPQAGIGVRLLAEMVVLGHHATGTTIAWDGGNPPETATLWELFANGVTS